MRTSDSRRQCHPSRTLQAAFSILTAVIASTALATGAPELAPKTAPAILSASERHIVSIMAAMEDIAERAATFRTMKPEL